MLLISILSADDRYAFVYSKNIDDRFINFYDKVVVDSDLVDNIYAIRYPKKMVAYVSVGEIDSLHKKEIVYDPSWIIGKNSVWNSLIPDLSNIDYQKFLFHRISNIYKKGYRNFFLDTLDSYNVVFKNKEMLKTQQKALVDIIHHIHKIYPNAKIILNRGFEVLDRVHSDISAVAAESLVQTYNHKDKSYAKVDSSSREWLLNNLNRVKEYGLDAISIDYSNQNSQKRLEIAREVRALGIIPYVTYGLLHEQCECDVERIRREVLILFQEHEFSNEDNSIELDIHHTLSMPLEYMGYVPHLYDIRNKPLPEGIEDRYRAVIVWGGEEIKKHDGIYEWIEMLMKKKIKVLLFNEFPFLPSEERLSKMGLFTQKNSNDFKLPSQVIYPSSRYQPYELKSAVEYEDNLLGVEEGEEILDVEYANAQKSSVIAITPWGGYALHNSALLNIGESTYWTINPYNFLKESLNLEDIPMPDPTTEGGRRILFVHIDGDGFGELVNGQIDVLSGEYMIENIFSKYKIPQTVSIIEGEFESIYAKYKIRMQEDARRLYEIPWIEPASHTLSHPFVWSKVVKPEYASPERGKEVHLPIKGYHFSLKKETIGSINYANQFAPKSKNKGKILFWSGDCAPTEKILAYVERKGIISMNGGDTTINKGSPTLDAVAPLGIQRGAYWQIYTGAQNENVYTHDWTGPFWAFRKVIETFKMTGEPRRVKPINIYFHLYAASRLAAFNALSEVYEWAIKQKTSKLYASQYIHIARGFFITSIAKRNNGYEIRNRGDLKTIRFDGKVDVDIAQSKGVAGYIYDNKQTYVTLDKRKENFIVLGKNDNVPHLIDTNGWVEKIEHKSNKFIFRLKANVPLKADFYLPSSCKSNVGRAIGMKTRDSSFKVSLASQKGVNIVFSCQ